MAYTTLATQSAGQTASAAGWANVVKANFDAMGPHLLVRKTSTEGPITSTTLQNDDVLVTPSIGANEVWLLYWRLLIFSASGTFKFALVYPSGTMTGAINTVTGDRIFAGPSGTSNNITDSNNASDGMTHILNTLFVNGATPGTVQLQWASLAGSNTSMNANSTLWGVKLA